MRVAPTLACLPNRFSRALRARLLGTVAIGALALTSGAALADSLWTGSGDGVHWSDGGAADLATVIGEINLLSAPDARAAYTQLAGASLSAVPTARFMGLTRFDTTVQANALRMGSSYGRPGHTRAGDDAAVDATSFHHAYDPDRQALGLDRLAELGQTLSRIGPALALSPQDGRTGLGTWISGYGVGGKVDSVRDVAGYTQRAGGVVLGADWRLSDTTTVGVALGYGRSELRHDNGDESNLRSVHGSLYGVWRPDMFNGHLTLDGAVGAARAP